MVGLNCTLPFCFIIGSASPDITVAVEPLTVTIGSSHLYSSTILPCTAKISPAKGRAQQAMHQVYAHATDRILSPTRPLPLAPALPREFLLLERLLPPRSCIPSHSHSSDRNPGRGVHVHMISGRSLLRPTSGPPEVFRRAYVLERPLDFSITASRLLQQSPDPMLLSLSSPSL